MQRRTLAVLIDIELKASLEQNSDAMSNCYFFSPLICLLAISLH